MLTYLTSSQKTILKKVLSTLVTVSAFKILVEFQSAKGFTLSPLAPLFPLPFLPKSMYCEELLAAFCTRESLVFFGCGKGFLVVYSGMTVANISVAVKLPWAAACLAVPSPPMLLSVARLQVWLFPAAGVLPGHRLSSATLPRGDHLWLSRCWPWNWQ